MKPDGSFGQRRTPKCMLSDTQRWTSMFHSREWFPTDQRCHVWRYLRSRTTRTWGPYFFGGPARSEGYQRVGSLALFWKVWIWLIITCWLLLFQFTTLENSFHFVAQRRQGDPKARLKDEEVLCTGWKIKKNLIIVTPNKDQNTK
jgi:hypothetical protein